ncbi:MAG: DNA primase [Xenococcaceae cyanobacterium]
MEIPRLHPDTIEEVKQKVNIVDIISERVVLRKRGRDFVGLCPFHDEKTGSFSVSPTKQLYYCFGCGAGGDAVKFLMELGKQSFTEAVFDLATRYQVPIKTLEPQQRQEIQRQISVREQLYEILAVAANFYEHALHQPQGEVALNYLKVERGLSEATIAQWNLGYAPAGWETLYRYLVEIKLFPLQAVETAGLIQKRKTGQGYYDRFRDRVSIPICDVQGRVIGFGTRSLGDAQPKYLNSPETPLFEKGKTLFSLNKARQSISQQDCALVVEGYFDAISLHAAGIKNVVASQGTALSQAQVTQLLRYTDSKRIIFNFDADNAGVTATQRAIGEIETMIYSGQVQLRILNLPDGKDADEFLKNPELEDSVERYRELIENAPLWLDWQIDRLVCGENLKQADRVQQVAQKMVKILYQIQDPNQRNYYLAYCAELISGGDSRLVPSNIASLKAQLKKPKTKIQTAKTKHLEMFNETKDAISVETRDIASLSNGFSAVRSLQQFNHKTYKEEFNYETSLNQSNYVTSLHQSSNNEIKIANSPETELLETTEALLLRIYLHYPEHRQEIVELLEEKNLLFSLPHYRFLWQQIIDIEQIEIQGADDSNLLLSLLDKRNFGEFSEHLNRVRHLFFIDEKTQEQLIGASLRIKEAIASLEQVILEKYLLYCRKKWELLKPSTDEDLKMMQFYYQEYQATEQKIKQLEQIRLSQTQFFG